MTTDTTPQKKRSGTRSAKPNKPGWTPARKKKLLTHFEGLYPEPASELNFSNTYQLVVAVVLSAQCTDKKVNEVTPELFTCYKNYKSLGKATPEDLEKILRPVNYYKTKSKNLVKLGKMVTEEFGGSLPTSAKELIKLPGVGQKTANVVVSELGTEYSFPVDTHVFRVSQRLGLVEGKTPEKVEERLKETFPPETWRPLHHWLIFHGRRVCAARSPKCDECTLAKLCHKRL
jgi:endonuclease-3